MRFRVVLLTAIASLAGLFGCSQKELTLSETEAPIITVGANPTNFGDIQVGSTASPIWIYVSPGGTGNSSDTVTSVVESCPNFSVAPDGLPAEVYRYCLGNEIPRSREIVAAAIPCSEGYEIVDYAFPAYFTPTIAGVQSCTITVVAVGGNKTIALSGNGLPPPREIELSRTSIAFGDVRRTTSSTPQTVVVSNLGSGELAVSSATVSSAVFTMSGAASVGIPGNGSYTYTLGCSPGEALGPLNGWFTIISNDGDEGTLTLPLSCNGVDSNLTVEPSPIALQARVDEPQEVTVQLVNSGSVPMDVTSVSIAGADLQLVTAPTGNIEAGGTMQARLRYSATDETEMLIEMRPRTSGPKSASLIITHAGGTTEIPLVGDGFELEVVAEKIGTYYSCSTRGAGAGGLWVFGLGLTVLALRRRRR